MKVMKPVVSGQFYPSNPDVLEEIVRGFLDKVKPRKVKGNPSSFIVPHAGIQISGPVAAYSYKQMENLSIKTFIIAGFNHRGWFDNIAVNENDFWQTPLGMVKIDKILAEHLVKLHPKIKFSADDCFADNSIEVQLPFIQAIDKEAMILPLAFGVQSFENCVILADVLFEILKERKDVMVLSSSDMSHYFPYDEAVKMDRACLELIKNFEIKNLYNKVQTREVELCGLAPVIASMMLSKKIGADSVELFKYANSGDVLGDRSGVVGYCSVGFYGGSLDASEQIYLLNLARGSIESVFKGRKLAEEVPSSENLQKKCGVFVTLTEKGILRGCIGYIEGIQPLYKAVYEMAQSAAFRDPRFPPLRESELKDLRIEISVLSPLVKIKDAEVIEVGKHGIYIRKGFCSGLLLPQVATEYKWDRITFLEQTCCKAVLEKDAWKEEDTEIYIFNAQIFHEEKL